MSNVLVNLQVVTSRIDCNDYLTFSLHYSSIVIPSC